MTKTEFLEALRERLNTLPSGDVDRSVEFYGEMIDDRMEDGMTESEAVANMGDLDRITEQIINQESKLEEISDSPFDTPSDAVSSHGRYVLRNPWVVGFLSPFLLILWAVAVVIVISLWAVVVACHAVSAALGFAGGGCHVAAFVLLIAGNPAQALFGWGIGVFLIGFTVLWSLGCKYLTHGVAKLCKLIFRGLVLMVVRKGESK